MSLHSLCKTLTILLAMIALTLAGHQGPSRITLESDGGYSGIVVKISDEVNDDYCSDIIENFQVRKIQFNSSNKLQVPNISLET